MIKLKSLIPKSRLCETELYHSTGKDSADSFIKNGIDIEKAGTKHGGAGGEEIGTGQGKGFYVFKNKNHALAHAKQQGDDIIVIIDQHVTPENFDVDYELEQKEFLKFFYNQTTLDYLRNKFKDAKHDNGNPVYYASKLSPNGVLQDMAIRVGDKVVKRSLPLDPAAYAEDDVTGIGEAASNRILSLFLQQYVPEKFEEFEKRHLPNAKALKYNGKDKIFPVRIEDLQGNVLWPTKTGV